MEILKLCFIRHIGVDIDGDNVYDMLFTDDIDGFWGENFEYMPCCLCNELTPNAEDYTLVKRLKTPIKLELIQNSCCFSFQDAADQIVSIGYAYDDNDNMLVNFMFGDTYDDTITNANKIGLVVDYE